MPKTIISDTSCLIILTNINELNLLQKLYGQIYTTVEIANEYGEALPDWIKITTTKDKTKQQLLELQIDSGEASALALAMEMSDCTVIIDDYKARKIATVLGINYTGTIGVIVRAKLKGEIASIKPLLEKIKQTNFRFSVELEIQALKEAKELEL